MQTVMAPKGIHCPVCLSPEVRSVGRYRPTAGRRIRYFVCKGCSHRFKTKEQFDGPIKATKRRKISDPDKAS